MRKHVKGIVAFVATARDFFVASSVWSVDKWEVTKKGYVKAQNSSLGSHSESISMQIWGDVVPKFHGLSSS